MTLVNSNDKEERLTREERIRASAADYSIRFKERSRAGQIPVRRGQHLDVDGILARSLPNPVALSAKDVKRIVGR